jgi:hypothetical protein
MSGGERNGLLSSNHGLEFPLEIQALHRLEKANTFDICMEKHI